MITLVNSIKYLKKYSYIIPKFFLKIKKEIFPISFMWQHNRIIGPLVYV